RIAAQQRAIDLGGFGMFAGTAKLDCVLEQGVAHACSSTAKLAGGSCRCPRSHIVLYALSKPRVNLAVSNSGMDSRLRASFSFISRKRWGSLAKFRAVLS